MFNILILFVAVVRDIVAGLGVADLMEESNLPTMTTTDWIFRSLGISLSLSSILTLIIDILMLRIEPLWETVSSLSNVIIGVLVAQVLAIIIVGFILPMTWIRQAKASERADKIAKWIFMGLLILSMLQFILSGEGRIATQTEGALFEVKTMRGEWQLVTEKEGIIVRVKFFRHSLLIMAGFVVLSGFTLMQARPYKKVAEEAEPDSITIE